MYVTKFLIAEFIEDANQVDHCIHAGKVFFKLCRLMYIGFHQLNTRQGQQLTPTFRTSAQYCHLPARGYQLLTQGTTNKAAAAQYTDPMYSRHIALLHLIKT